NCFEARYEDLRQDVSLTHWRKISAFLGFDEREQQISSHCFWHNSLFGGLSRIGNKHVRSGDIAQWKRELTKDLGYAFVQRFPDTLQSLGYEINNGWISQLQPAGSTGLFAALLRLAGSASIVASALAASALLQAAPFARTASRRVSAASD